MGFELRTCYVIQGGALKTKFQNNVDEHFNSQWFAIINMNLYAAATVELQELH